MEIFHRYVVPHSDAPPVYTEQDRRARERWERRQEQLHVMQEEQIRREYEEELEREAVDRETARQESIFEDHRAGFADFAESGNMYNRPVSAFRFGEKRESVDWKKEGF